MGCGDIYTPRKPSSRVFRAVIRAQSQVPNLTFGPELIAACRKYTKVPFETQLMVSNYNCDTMLEQYVATTRHPNPNPALTLTLNPPSPSPSPSS